METELEEARSDAAEFGSSGWFRNGFYTGMTGLLRRDYYSVSVSFETGCETECTSEFLANGTKVDNCTA